MVSLLELKDGGCSLEFTLADINRLRTELSVRYGKPKVTKYPILTVYTFGRTELTFQNEWDDPCLIASTPDGVAMLRTLAADLAGSAASG
jgi:hypothetical protein